MNDEADDEGLLVEAARAFEASVKDEEEQEQQQQQQQQEQPMKLEEENDNKQEYTEVADAAAVVEAAKVSDAIVTSNQMEQTADPTAAAAAAATTTIAHDSATTSVPDPTANVAAATTTSTNAAEVYTNDGASAGDKRKAPPEGSASEMANNTNTNNNNKRAAASSSNRPMRVPWEDRIQQLKDYKAAHGSLAIPIRYKDNPSLGKFVHNTREQYKLFHNRTKEGYKKKCSLTPERIEELEAMGFLWTTERSKRQNHDWNNRLQQLKEYKKIHGHCRVPHGYEEDPSFAEWIHRQRTTYASILKDPEETSALVKDRMKQLEELGFNFTVHSDKWMDHYEQLKLYKRNHGDCLVPTHYADNPQLGRWTHTQRHQRRLQSKGKRSCMTKERIAMLDALGFQWEVRPAFERPRATWQQRYDELRIFHMKHGHFRVTPDTTKGDNPDADPLLHAWALEQRARLRNIEAKGKDSSRRMGPDRVDALARIGFSRDVDLVDALPAKGPPKKETKKPSKEDGETVASLAAKLIIPPAAPNLGETAVADATEAKTAKMTSKNTGNEEEVDENTTITAQV